jgi:hypothetical protein
MGTEYLQQGPEASHLALGSAVSPAKPPPSGWVLRAPMLGAWTLSVRSPGLRHDEVDGLRTGTLHHVEAVLAS